MEIPSIQNEIASYFDNNNVQVLGVILRINDIQLLRNFKYENGITFPLIPVDGSFFEDYEVGHIFGNYPPSYFIINTDRIIERRYDNLYGIAEIIRQEITNLLND